MRKRRSPGDWCRRVIYGALLIWACVLVLLVVKYMFFDTQKPEVVIHHSEEVQPISQKKNPLDNMDMPMRKLKGGGTEPCLNVPDEQTIVEMKIPPFRIGEIEKLEYYNNSGGGFAGNPTMLDREDNFKVRSNMTVHCGFCSQGSGFDIDEKDRNFMNSCDAVVSTCIFGGGDVLYQPINMTEASLSKVCYVAFMDEPTVTQMAEDGLKIDDETSKIGYWRAVVVRNLPFTDNRRNGKVPKMLGHRLFPNARYSIWVDSKYQFRRDPMAVLNALLWTPNASLAISNHGARSCVYKEGEAVVAKHKALPAEVDVQLTQYKSEGLPPNAVFEGHKALAEASVIVRDHSEASNLFMCLWFNEVCRFTARDQLSFPYVLSKFGRNLRVNMFPVCTRKSLVNSLGHKRKPKATVL